MDSTRRSPRPGGRFVHPSTTGVRLTTKRARRAADAAIAALIDDLDQRGLLDETLVVATGEFGRTPKINSVAGRDHWPDAFSVLLAGAGLPGGAYYGATDKQGAFPIDRLISPARLAATIFHALGIDPQLELSTTLGRPWRLVEEPPALDLWG